MALFTCATTRAVHLELVRSMSAEHFLLALEKFIARRGFPSLLLSDNAKTFRSISHLLETTWSDDEVTNVQEYLSKKRITWRHIVEAAPWWGGFWERMVRTVKDKLKKTLWRAMLTFEELSATLSQVEAMINA